MQKSVQVVVSKKLSKDSGEKDLKVILRQTLLTLDIMIVVARKGLLI